MKSLLIAILLAALIPANAADRDLVVVTGAEGEAAYQPIFRKESDAWSTAAASAGIKVHALQNATRVDFQKALQAFPKDGGDLWLVLIGHGTFEGRSAKFNLRGDDITSTELAAWLEPFHRRVIVWNLFSASGAFLSDLSRDNRVVITATRNGTEGNYSRFGELLAERLTAPDSDLDGDGVTSVLELVVSASSHTQASYENDQRLLSEHAQLDDNGDGVGAESVALLHPSPKSGLVPDGAIAATISLARDDSAPSLTAAQISQRAGIEARIAALRERKAEMNEALYYQKLESLLLEMARLYQHARAESGQ